jgi:lysophospholipid acyltransferase (LPLAT)-like uncharacterized protein
MQVSTQTSRLERAYEFSDLSDYSAKDRLLIRMADLVFFALIKLIGGTTRWQIEGRENWEAAGKTPIYALWHNRVFLATHFLRHRRIVVMTSQSFDGEYIARFIKRFGFGTARGSSTRGATSAFVQMVRLMRAGCPTAFTVDGPKGPRYIAKMGPVRLARKTGQPILPFTITARRYWEVKSWDRFQVPLPFTRALISFASPIHVASDADQDALEAKRDELQISLEAVNRRGDDWLRQRAPTP